MLGRWNHAAFKGAVIGIEVRQCEAEPLSRENNVDPTVVGTAWRRRGDSGLHGRLGSAPGGTPKASCRIGEEHQTKAARHYIEGLVLKRQRLAIFQQPGKRLASDPNRWCAFATISGEMRLLRRTIG
jgi:hypothetical protein